MTPPPGSATTSADPSAPTGRAPRATALGTLAVELRHAIMRTSRRIRQERSIDDVTPGQYSVLAGLDTQGPQTPREIAAREKVQPPSMTRTLAALEELGLVSRSDHPTDGRQVLMGLTSEGAAVVRETRRRRDAWLAQRLAELSPAERETLARAATILERMASL